MIERYYHNKPNQKTLVDYGVDFSGSAINGFVWSAGGTRCFQDLQKCESHLTERWQFLINWDPRKRLVIMNERMDE